MPRRQDIDPTLIWTLLKNISLSEWHEAPDRLFYRIAGPQAAAIDGPTSYTIPPYNESATLGPRDPDGAARRLAAAIDQPVAVIDANDAGCNVLGASPGIDRELVRRLFADNPLGQAREQTPIAIVRRVAWPAGQPLPAEPRRKRA